MIINDKFLQISKDTLQNELDELSKSLMEEAHVLVADEARKRRDHEFREKALEKEIAEVRSQLQMEQLQLRELKIKIEEARAVEEAEERMDASSVGLFANSGSGNGVAGGDDGSRRHSKINNDSYAGDSVVPQSTLSNALAGGREAYSPGTSLGDPVDPMPLIDFQDFLAQAPTIKLSKLHSLAFMKTTLEDDVNPCLRFGGNPRTSTRRIVDAIMSNSCFVEEMTPSQIALLSNQHNALRDLINSGADKRNSTSSSSETLVNIEFIIIIIIIIIIHLLITIIRPK